MITVACIAAFFGGVSSFNGPFGVCVSSWVICACALSFRFLP